MSRTKEWSADSVLSRLEKTTFSAPAHCMLREVRNATGYSRTARSADALAVSLWPSRGLWFAGIEVKVARYDWLRELKDPEKSADIQQFCHYWWIAAPAGVVELSELPETWGLIEVGGTKNEIRKQAPRLEVKELRVDFVAAVFRNMASQKNYARAKIRAELEAELGAPVSDDVAKLQKSVETEKLNYKHLQTHYNNLQEKVRVFERESGVRVDDPWRSESIGPAFHLAQRIRRADLSSYANNLETLAREMRAVQTGCSELAEGEAAE